MMERVQVIAASLSSIGGGGGGGGELSGVEIPPEFIRSEHERPGATTCEDGPDIPVVDLSNADQDEVSRAISDASCEWGILQLVNHGIPAEVITALQRVGRDFFELPQEEKEKYARPPGSHEGYGTSVSKDLQGKKAWSDFIFHYIWPPARINYDIWPKNPTDYRSANEEYSKWAVQLVQQILVNLSKGLALEKDALMAALGGEDLEVLLKINYYPRCPRPDLALGVVAHTDMSAITLLVPNDVQGLQVLKDERWIDVKHIPGAIIVHIGDQIEILSNGRYKSVLHRTTVNKDKVRMSWPVFCSPPQEMVIGPLPQFVSDQNPAKYKAKKYKDYSYCKLNKLPQ